MLAVIGLVIIGALGVFLAERGGGHVATTDAALQTRVLAAYQPLTIALLAVTKADEAVLGGTGSPTQVRQALDDARAPFADTAARVRSLPKSTALLAYASAADLYAAYRDLRLVAIDMPTGDLQVQVDLMGRRVKVLADRVYDRGKVALTGLPVESPGVSLLLPDDVPSFPAEQLAAGPPLAPPPMGPTPVEPDRAAARPTTSDAAWVAAARLDGAPTSTDVASALRHGSATTLQTLASRFDGAELVLRAGPDPGGPGGRERNNLLRLTTLVYADAVRARQAATLAPPSIAARLAALASQLATVGDSTWDPGVGLRHSTT